MFRTWLDDPTPLAIFLRGMLQNNVYIGGIEIKEHTTGMYKTITVL